MLNSSKKLFQQIKFVENDIVVHRNYGIGRFISLELIEVNNQLHDCLKISYADEDKLYIPVENANLVTKYGTNENAKLDKLGSKAWQQKVSNVNQKLHDIAFELIQVIKKRQLIDLNPLKINYALYNNICNKFPYNLTKDQERSVNEIKEDLESGKLMDRLLCADVGFGKTEVAIRTAAMLLTSDNPKKQIVIMAPTTLLAKQHYKLFQERFSEFGFNIAQISRIIPDQEQKKIKEQVKKGEVNILIGTHAILSEINFHGLGLLIIDEEQHFGVKQKEKLKKLYNNIHVLTISATPIPRSLYMSITGSRDLSIIATPPKNRKEVECFLENFSPIKIKEIILFELGRQGQIFIVCPYISDLEVLESLLHELIPNLKYRIAHGRLKASELDNIINEFYEKKIDILISTTIVESGLDIENANSIIIYNAHLLGLSQLYQLRGRVGRRDKKGYVYYIVPKQELLDPKSLRRLELITSLTAFGSSFILANHDVDLRGFGDLFGSKQSGHIKNIGLELYQDLLANKLFEIDNNISSDLENNIDPIIDLDLPIYISQDYISDNNFRLDLYKKIASVDSLSELQQIKAEVVNLFGPLCATSNNLFIVIEIKLKCAKLGIEKLNIGFKGALIKINRNYIKDFDDFLLLISKNKKFSFKNDDQIAYKDEFPEDIKIEKIFTLINTIAGFLHDKN